MNVEGCCHTGFCLPLNGALTAGRASCYRVSPAPSPQIYEGSPESSTSFLSSIFHPLSLFFPMSPSLTGSRYAFASLLCFYLCPNHYSDFAELKRKWQIAKKLGLWMVLTPHPWRFSSCSLYSRCKARQNTGTWEDFSKKYCKVKCCKMVISFLLIKLLIHFLHLSGHLVLLNERLAFLKYGSVCACVCVWLCSHLRTFCAFACQCVGPWPGTKLQDLMGPC